MREIGFVEVGCRRPGHHCLPCFDLVSREHRIMMGDALGVGKGKVIAQNLFNGSRYQGWIIAQSLVELWLPTETIESSSQQHGGRDMACCYQLQAQVENFFMCQMRPVLLCYQKSTDEVITWIELALVQLV